MINVAVAPQRNVPKPVSRAKTVENINQTKATGASVIFMTECFNFRTRIALRNQFSNKKGWSLHAPRGSAILAFDTSVWEEVNRWVVFGHSAISGVCDQRDIPAVALRHKVTREVINFYAIHPTPIPTKKAPGKVGIAKIKQARFFLHLKHDMYKHPGRSVLGGDFNTVDNALGTSVGGRLVHYNKATGDKIVQAVFVDSKVKHWSEARIKKELVQKFSDHLILSIQK